jgi:subtilisin family serine protease
VRVYQFRHIRAEEQCTAGLRRSLHSIPVLKRGLLVLIVLLVVLPGAAPAGSMRAGAGGVEVVVTLAAPPLARYHWSHQPGARRLAISTPRDLAYLRSLATAQREVASRIIARIPGASVGWRYSIVANGLSVVIQTHQLSMLGRVPGVARVWPSVRYHALLDRTPALIGANRLWGSTLATAGEGIKIGIIDDGVDQTHPFFNPSGYSYPAGFPKGDTRYTTPKVIVARAFAPPGTTYANATLPFDPKESDHATHVAGIAAGNNGTLARNVRVSGIAPRAYLGNYKALSVPTPDFGLDGNSPELVAAIEAAVRDGMDVINLSLGEPEIDPRRDIVVRALNAAADAGVVPVIAAGNDFADFGRGSIGSPGNAAKAIAAAASTGAHGSPTPDRVASFSSGGPTPYSLQFKPDVTAPGVQVLSSVPARAGLWVQFSGTSMATPHVAGGAALLRQRHPSWTVAQIKSALVLTGVPVRRGRVEVPATREGGGRIDLVRADDPLVFAEPSSLAFGLVPPGRAVKRTISLADAGGGAGIWSARIRVQGSTRGLVLMTPQTVTVPGTVTIRAGAARGAAERDVTGFVVLTRADGATRHIPFWYRVARTRLPLDRARTIARPGVYTATTIGAPSRVVTYRYPSLSPTSVSFPTHLDGAEVVFRLRLSRAVSNFGVVVLRGHVQPRIVRGADENLLAGYTALPLDLNPYRSTYGMPRPVVGAVLPSAGTYSLVFDSTRRTPRGPFTFRFWIGDAVPPAIRLAAVSPHTVTLSVRDAQSGVDPASLRATVDGSPRRVPFADGLARIDRLAAGRHTITLRAADYEETKNMEDVGPVLPNTRLFRTVVTLR